MPKRDSAVANGACSLLQTDPQHIGRSSDEKSL